LAKVLNLLSGCVDVLSSEGHLNAILAMELSQMVVQAAWDRDSPLVQVPHFTPEVVKKAEAAGITDVLEFTEVMSGPKAGATAKKLGLDKKQLMQAAAFANKYPNLDLEFEVEEADEITAGSPSYLHVKISREVDEDDEEPDTSVDAPFYPGKKVETWWLVVGGADGSLLAIKKVSIGAELDMRLEFVVPEPGKHKLTLYLMSDSYMGVDQDPKFEVTAAEGMDEDEDEDEEDEESS
jgi:pre-mRNA-splicing helicase BRR2